MFKNGRGLETLDTGPSRPRGKDEIDPYWVTGYEEDDGYVYSHNLLYDGKPMKFKKSDIMYEYKS